MRLMTAHKILIGTSIAFFVLFSAIQWRGISKGTGSLPVALAGAGAAVLLGVYFGTLRNK